MTARAIALAIACAGVAGACTDPGCIRNSECPIDLRCIESACVRASTDGGAGNAAPVLDGATAGTDASTTPPPRDAAPPRDTNPSGEDAGR